MAGAWSDAGTGAGAAGVGAVGVAAVGVEAAGAGAASAVAPEGASSSFVAVVFLAAVFFAAVFLAAGLSAGGGMASRSRRATGASTVEEADFTNSPRSCSLASTSLLVTPSSFASSWTRTFDTTLLSWSGQGAPDRQCKRYTFMLACSWGVHPRTPGPLVRRWSPVTCTSGGRLAWCCCHSSRHTAPTSQSRPVTAHRSAPAGGPDPAIPPLAAPVPGPWTAERG